MKLNFYIRYFTRPGEALSITGNIAELGNNDAASAVAMQYFNNEFWSVSIAISKPQKRKLQYSYLVTKEDGTQVKDMGKDRIVELSIFETDEVEFVDYWNDQGIYENAYYTSPFQEILLTGHEGKSKSKDDKPFTHIFRVKAP